MGDELSEFANVSNTAVLQFVLAHFLSSAATESFNGILAENLLALTDSEAQLRQVLIQLVGDDQLECLFCAHDPNPYIMRHRPLPKRQQQTYLEGEALSSFCVYPSASILRSAVGDAELTSRPFSRMLLLGQAQLEPIAFDMAALDRYGSDPRYRVTFNDYMGTMSIRDDYYFSDQTEPGDKTSIQSFGIGFAESEKPVLIVFLRYLANLTDQHQQFWNSYRLTLPAKMCRQYYQSAIQGEFWQNRSIRYAISKEIMFVNQLANSLYGKPLFRKELTTEIPVDLTAFVRPTHENFLRFVSTLDKVLSDNVNVDFFAGRVERDNQLIQKDGKVRTTQKGSLTLLNEWLGSVIHWGDDTFLDEVVMSPLKEVRKIRQKPAHHVTKDYFSETFYIERRDLLSRVFASLSSIRRGLMSLPGSPSLEIPEWLQQAEVEVF